MLDDRVQPQRGVGQRAVVADRHGQSTQPRQTNRRGDHPPARRGEEDEADRGKNVDAEDVVEGGAIPFGGLPPRTLPWLGAEAGDDRSVRAADGAWFR